ncbi:MAG: hypothetical protein Q4G51_00695 [Dermatophilus congolensis]|nr:hypothetical protein [Dermatophilus congolensis]
MVRSEAAAGAYGAIGMPGVPVWGALEGSCATVPSVDAPLAEVIPLPVRHASEARRPRSTQLVLTRRGRLVRTFVVAFLVALLALMVAARVGAPGEVESARTAVVGQGQTLIDVASRELPGMPLDDAVMAIRVFNDLGGTSVQAGQALRIPKL